MHKMKGVVDTDSTIIRGKNLSQPHHSIVTDTQRKKPYVCDVCKKSFSKSNHLTAHQYCHTGEKPFHCSVCGIKFRNQTSLRRHESSHGSQEFKCSVCNVGFANETKLKYHMRRPGIHENLQIPDSGEKNCKNHQKSSKKGALHVLHDSNQEIYKTEATENKEIETESCSGFLTNESAQTEKLLNGQSKQNISLEKDDTNFPSVEKKSCITFVCGTCSKVFDELNSLTSHACSQTQTMKSKKDKRYVCDLCNASFAKTNHLREHRFCHTGDKPFTCDVCNIAFRNKSNLRRHKMDHGSQDYKCPVCKVGFASQIKLEFHQRKHDVTYETKILKKTRFQDVKINSRNPIGNVKCTNTYPGTKNQISPSSKRVYRGVMDLQMGLKHLKLGVTSNEDDTGDVNIQKPHSNAITVVQDTEIIAFPFSPSIVKHPVTVIVTHEKIIIDLHSLGGIDNNFSSNKKATSCGGQCNESDNRSNFPDESIQISTTQTTMDSVTDDENFEEKSPEGRTTDTPKSENHSQESNGVTRTNSKTETKKTANHGNFRKETVWKDVIKHIKDGQVHYTCNKCDITCPDLASMTVHARSQAHIRFSCDFCGKVYNCGHRSRYLRHLRTHTGERPYMCEICGKGFTCAQGLQIHHISHSKERPHHCNVCGKGFSNTGSLHEHERIHTGEKRHQCETCGKSFTHRASLKRHVSMHTGITINPFKCKDCPKEFPMNFLLKRHMTTHTGEKAFKCYICQKAFTSSSHLARHKRKNCKAVSSSILNNCKIIEEKREGSMPEFCIDNEQKAVSSIVVGNEFAVSLPLVQSNAETQSADSIYMTVPKPNIIDPSSNQLVADTEIYAEEVVVKTETVETSESTDNLYQCTGCSNTFMDLDTATNHNCSEN